MGRGIEISPRVGDGFYYFDHWEMIFQKFDESIDLTNCYCSHFLPGAKSASGEHQLCKNCNGWKKWINTRYDKCE